MENSKLNIGKKQTFWQLICNENLKIKIPLIQRDYVQGRNTPQVELARKNLLQDLAQALTTSKTVDLNFIYGNIEEIYFIPIDGQQRLTTLFLLHAYAFAKENQIDCLKILKDNFIYETRITTDRFFKDLVLNLPTFFKEKKDSDLKEYINDASWFSDTWLDDPSIYSSIIVLDEINKTFAQIEDMAKKLIQDDCPIFLMSLRIFDMGKANDLYIKMNSRGKILSYFESFKAELFDFIDSRESINWPNFKRKIDNDWQNLIWEGCRFNALDPFKLCDIKYLYLIHFIIVNRVIPKKENYEFSKINKMVNNNGFFAFDNYREFLQNTPSLNDIYQTFEFLKFLKETDEECYTKIMTWLIKIIEKPEWSERVLIFAITKYAITEKNWNIKNFLDYNRIMNNLIQNTVIDTEQLYSNACNSINNFNDLVFKDAETYFATRDEITTSKINFFFNREQLKEERYKCLLIKGNAEWKNELIMAEKNTYFNGEIAFALKLTGADLNDFSSNEKLKIEEFKNTWKEIALLFNDNGLRIDDNLFSRALLTFGDYSMLANSSYSFFFEGKKGYFNWRRMLREKKSFDIFKKFFDSIKHIKTNEELVNELNYKINSFNDESDEFLFYLIKYPELFKYMDEKRYIICNNKWEKHRIILYSKSRLSAEYSEFHTYILKVIFKENINYHFGHGYLDNEDSFAHIDSICKKESYIEYDEKFRDKFGNPLMNGNKEVVSIKEAIEYINKIIKDNKLS